MPGDGDQPKLDPTGRHRQTLLTHDEYLARRLHLHALARFVVALLIVAGAWSAGPLLGIEGLDARGLSLLGLVIFLYNLVILLLVRPRLEPARAVRALPMLRGVLYGSILADYLALTIAIWFVGGSRSPFLAFYLFHVIIASLLLSRSAAWAAALIAWLLLSVLVIGEHRGLIPPRAPAGFIPGGGFDGRYLLTILSVYGVLFLLTAALLTNIAELLRRGERTCRDNIVALEQLNELRRDFLHITTHNLQSPVGAASMLLRNLDDGLCGELTPAQHDQLRRAIKRLDELTAFLADLRTLAQIEVGDAAGLRTELVDIRPLLAELIEANADLTRRRGHTLVLEIDRPVPAVWTSRRLLREAVENYITNAVKYTPPGGTIRVRALPVDRIGPDTGATRGVRIEVIDNGIGISPDDQKRLFKELVRIKTEHPELGHVAGTGLGLSIVRRIVTALGGRGGVESRPGRGSTFWIELPAG